jgi:hypothetical protein
MSSKSDWINNPKSGRPIRVGGKVYLKMVKDGLIEKLKDDNELSDLPVSEEEQQEKIKELNESLPVEYQAVKGRGKYKNKLVKRSKALPTETNARASAKIACDVIKENINLIAETDDADIENLLEQLILENLTKSAPRAVSSLRSEQRLQTTGQKYQIADISDSDSSETDSDES